MSLYGSLGSFPLDEILGLLGATGHTGALEITRAGTSSRLYLREGAVVAAQGEGGADEAPLDTLVRLLRLDEGEFSFSPDVPAAHPGMPLEVAALLRAAREQLDELRRIEVALPSPDHVVRLAPTAATPEVTLTADQWRTLAMVARGGRIGELLEELGGDDLTGLRALKALVDAQLIELADDDEVGLSAEEGEEDDCDQDDQDDDLQPDGPDGEDGSGRPGNRIVLLPRRPARSWPAVDPGLAGTLDALAVQFDQIYESVRVAAAVAEDDREAAGAGQGFLARLRHRPQT